MLDVNVPARARTPCVFIKKSESSACVQAFHLECVVSAMPPDGSLHAEAPESGAAAPPTSLTNTGPSGEELLPFAGMLSCFTNLTELHWEHHPRQQDTCAYAAALAKSLKQLVHLKALSINAGVHCTL